MPRKTAPYGYCTNPECVWKNALSATSTPGVVWCAICSEETDLASIDRGLADYEAGRGTPSDNTGTPGGAKQDREGPSVSPPGTPGEGADYTGSAEGFDSPVPALSLADISRIQRDAAYAQSRIAEIEDTAIAEHDRIDAWAVQENAADRRLIAEAEAQCEAWMRRRLAEIDASEDRGARRSPHRPQRPG